MDEIKNAATAVNPRAALEKLLDELQAYYKATAEEMQDARADYEKQLNAALKGREKMAELWPDAPAACYIYASFCRPFSEYGRPPESVQAQRHQQADWGAHIPHSYIASTAPLELPQVELLRVPLI